MQIVNIEVHIITDNYKVKATLRKGNYCALTKTLNEIQELQEDNIRTKFTPHHSEQSHLYGLPMIHKSDMPFGPITSS